MNFLEFNFTENVVYQVWAGYVHMKIYIIIEFVSNETNYCLSSRFQSSKILSLQRRIIT